MYDGDAVALALYLRALKRPEIKMAQNIWKYLAEVSVPQLAEQYPQRKPAELRQLSAQLRKKTNP